MSKIVPLLSIVHSQVNEPQPQDKVYSDQDMLSPKTVALENQQLHTELASLSQRFEYQANVNFELESQIKGMQAENEILLNALEENDESLPLLLLRERIRHIEQSVIDKDEQLKNEKQQNELLLNELLAKG